MKQRGWMGLFFALTWWGCTSTVENDEVVQPLQDSTYTLFNAVAASHSNITFTNTITEDVENNYFKYQYVYNGGGVAVGDFNNDALPDVYFTGNMVKDHLYLNKGALSFEDITASAIAEGNDGWHTGVTTADVNDDGWLDIYVCRSGKTNDPKQLANLLYLNNGDLTFTESAAKWGIADTNHSTQAAFFDYDRDGDLDLYVMNTPAEFDLAISPKEYYALFESRKNRSDRLYRNEGNRFEEVSYSAGINNHAFGLGLSVGDLNDDGWPDIYIANDYDEGDYMFINQQNGTFREEIKQRTKHISNFGMGTDIADFNNDGYLDIVELDMAFADHVRSKRNMASMSTEKFWGMVEQGKHFQYMVNTLQMNNGNNNFSEVAQLAGIAKTDWSWAPLFADFDNDGDKDLVITNGYKRDAKDRDFQNSLETAIKEKGQLTFEETMALMPSTKIRNYLFANNGDLTFKEQSEEWGFDKAINSNGVAYADFDNDGDLDLAINNIDEPASIYENKVNKRQNYLRIKLIGIAGNKWAYGARVTIASGDEEQVQELQATRGFQSAVEPVLHFGLGQRTNVDLLTVQWPDGKITTMKGVQPNQLLNVDANGATHASNNASVARPFSFAPQNLGINYMHKENPYNDFAKEILLPHKQSANGPSISTGDVNGDGLDDFYIGGASGSAGALHVQTTNGTFTIAPNPTFEADKACEDLGSLLFDADGDGDLDLYVVSGGNEVAQNSKLLQDRLYFNNGHGQYKKSAGALPEMLSSGKKVIAGDYDNDGDLDLFVGGRIVPGNYPMPARSYLLQNDGGKFIDATKQEGPGLETPGLVTDAAFTDYDNDGDLDLFIIGEWMTLTLFNNELGDYRYRYENITEHVKLNNTEGFWYSLLPGDFDNDGDIDFVAGNFGKNHKFKGSIDKPFNVYCGDFDGTGTNDIVLSSYQNGKNYPVRGRECSSEQMPFLQQKFPTYKEFAEADLVTLYTEEQLNNALHLEAKYFKSSFIRNNGDNTFTVEALPNAAQIAPVMGMVMFDINKDGHKDIIMAGNHFDAEVETVRHDAGIGMCLLGDGTGKFKPMSVMESGFYAPANVKDVQMVFVGVEKQPVILVANNNFVLQAFVLNAIAL